MGDDDFEVFDADYDVQHVVDAEVAEVAGADGYRCCERLLKNLCSMSVTSSTWIDVGFTFASNDLLRITREDRLSILSIDIKLLCPRSKVPSIGCQLMR